MGLYRRHSKLRAACWALLNAETASQSAEELRQRTLARHTAGTLLVERGTGRVHEANAALMAPLGMRAGEQLGRPQRHQHIDAATLDRWAHKLQKADGLQAARMEVHRIDGPVRHRQISAERLSVGVDRAVFCIGRDVSEQPSQDVAPRAAYDAAVADLAQSGRRFSRRSWPAHKLKRNRAASRVPSHMS